MAVGVLGYILGMFINRERDNSFKELLEEIVSNNNDSELRQLVEENIKVQTRLVVLIEQQGESLRQIMERMNTLWEKILQINTTS